MHVFRSADSLYIKIKMFWIHMFSRYFVVSVWVLLITKCKMLCWLAVTFNFFFFCYFKLDTKLNVWHFCLMSELIIIIWSSIIFLMSLIIVLCFMVQIKLLSEILDIITNLIPHLVYQYLLSYLQLDISLSPACLLALKCVNLTKELLVFGILRFFWVLVLSHCCCFLLYL